MVLVNFWVWLAMIVLLFVVAGINSHLCYNETKSRKQYIQAIKHYANAVDEQNKLLRKLLHINKQED